MHSPRPLWLQSLIVFWAQAEEKIFISQSAASWVERERERETGGWEGVRVGEGEEDAPAGGESK